MCSESVYQHTNSAKGVCEYMMLVLLAELLMGSRSDAICGTAEHKHDLFFLRPTGNNPRHVHRPTPAKGLKKLAKLTGCLVTRFALENYRAAVQLCSFVSSLFLAYLLQFCPVFGYIFFQCEKFTTQFATEELCAIVIAFFSDTLTLKYVFNF